MKAFVTGSRAYGNSRNDSDIDLVVFVSQKDRVMEMADNDLPSSLSDDPKLVHTISLRFGALNILACCDQDTWRKGTLQLKDLAPVTRQKAVEVFTALRKEASIS